eukprot:scaffold493_cov258-Chaetoceros_neogracile.AAC.9
MIRPSCIFLVAFLNGSHTQGFVNPTARVAAKLVQTTPSSLQSATIQSPPSETQVKITTTEIEVRKSLDVRIHGTWYDLTKWRVAHPAGSHWIDMYDGRDCTEVMDAFHSEKARSMWQRLPRTDEKTVSMLEISTPEDTSVQKDFRALRVQLEEEGWFKREIFHEVKLLGILSSLLVGAAVTAHSIPKLSIMLLSVAFTNAGWIGHDYIHGTDKFSEKMRMLAPMVAGLGCTWWSNKHNKHHAATNEMGVDADMGEGPLLYTYAPDPANDSPFRKVQHITFPIVFSLLFLLWRVRSIQIVVPAIEEKRTQAKEELYSLMIHYAVLLTVFPASVWVPSVFISGLMSAFIVTPTHQSDVFFVDKQEDWVTAQFRSTRNAVLSNPFSTWLWGGMQYQLEHHLFPAMPRSKYPKLRSIIKKFANAHDLEYLESGELKILKMNWELYRDVARADPVKGAPSVSLYNVKDKVRTAAL